MQSQLLFSQDLCRVKAAEQSKKVHAGIGSIAEGQEHFRMLKVVTHRVGNPVMASELANDAPSGNIPGENRTVSATRG